MGKTFECMRRGLMLKRKARAFDRFAALCTCGFLSGVLVECSGWVDRHPAKKTKKNKSIIFAISKVILLDLNLFYFFY